MAAQSESVKPSAASETALSIASLTIKPSNNAELRRPNFPLPRELRDHVYKYLLHSDYTRVVRNRSQDLPSGQPGPISRQAYKFHTNISPEAKARSPTK